MNIIYSNLLIDKINSQDLTTQTKPDWIDLIPIFSERKTIKITNVVIDDSFEFALNPHYNLWFDNCVFNNDCKFTNSYLHKISIFNCHFKFNLIIDYSTFEDDFLFFNNKVDNVFRVEYCNIKTLLSCQRNNIKYQYISQNIYIKHFVICDNNEIQSSIESLEVENNKIDFFAISDNANIESCYISQNEFEHFLIDGGTFQTLSISNINSKNRARIDKNTKVEREFRIDNSLQTIHLLIDSVDIKEFNLLGVFKRDSILELNEIKFNIFNFDSFLNYGNIYIKNILAQGKDPQINIELSDLGKTSFIGSDLRNVILNFKSSKIVECFISNTELPNKISTENSDENQKRLIFSQLKKVFENRGDSVQANNYLAQEMNSFYSSLKWKWGINAGWFKNGKNWEIINLGLNKFSSNHGHSWQRGLFSTFIVSVFLYTLYCKSLGYYISLPSTKLNVENFLKLSSYFLEFINPIHKADFIAEKVLAKGLDIPSISRFIEGISRIFITYFVYQLIQAFRKHGKK